MYCSNSFDVSSFKTIFSSNVVVRSFLVGIMILFCSGVVSVGSSTDSSEGNCSGTSCGTCIGPEYNSQSAQNNFNNCFNQLSSTTCIPPIPLAINNENILYYPFTPTKCACLDATGQNPCLS